MRLFQSSYALKEAYVAALTKKSASARLISAADKLHNARSILADHERVGSELWERFSAGEQEQLWYYGALVEAFMAAGDQPALTAALHRVVTALRLRCAPA